MRIRNPNKWTQPRKADRTPVKSRSGFTRFSTQNISARVGGNQAARAQQNSHHFRGADGFFNIGRKLDRGPPVRDTSNLGPLIQTRHRQSDSNEIPLVSAHLHSSSVGLRSVAILFILAIHSSTSVWRRRGAQFTHGFSCYSSIAKETACCAVHSGNDRSQAVESYWPNAD